MLYYCLGGRIAMSKEFKLEYHAATIQHLGIGLYKQLPQAIAELISNSWDADSHKVEVNIDYAEKIITVSDDGNGMSAQELNENFLTIARNRRLSDIKKGGISGLSKSGNRAVTGKKGLGKLALFGIADTVIIESIQNGKKNSFKLSYDAIQNSSSSTYHPQTLSYEEKTPKPNGTKITIKNITLKSLTPIDTLYESLAKRFNKYSRDDFLVTITSEKNEKRELDESVFVNSIRPKDEEIEFTFEFPKDFLDMDNKIISELHNKGITGTIFTKRTPLSATSQGFSVLSRGKLASEHSTTQFQDRANDNFYQYATGYFDIDYLDHDAKKDFISTDRQSIRWEADDELLEIKNNLNKLIGIIQGNWRKKRAEAKQQKARENQEKSPIVKKTNFSESDQRILDDISQKLEDDNVNIPDSKKQDILNIFAKSTNSYKKDNSVYKELVPKNFFVPDTIGTKIRMLREEMLEAAEDKNINRFILTQGLLLRAMIDSTTTSYLRKYWEEATNNNLIEQNGKIYSLKSESEVDSLAFATKYKTMVKLLSKHGKIKLQRVDSLSQEFDNVQVKKHLDLLMHDAENFPQFETLKAIWNCVAPQLSQAFNDMN